MLCRVLQYDVLYGACNDLNVNIPPRNFKSQMISVLFVMWYMGHFPHKKVLIISHASGLTGDLHNACRNVAGSLLYRRLFPKFDISSKY